MLSDSLMTGASVSFILTDATTGETITEYQSESNLVPASVMKLITSSAALELLSPDYRFKTLVGFSGKFNRHSGILTGDLIIKGGGDPSLGSERFGMDAGFINELNAAVAGYGIKKVKGSVIVDDSRYDYEPVPAGWLWEDIGNYYGAGVFGLSVFDNTLKIHFRTGYNGSKPEILQFDPPKPNVSYISYLIASGSSDKGYVFCAPYSERGWISGTIPEMKEDFILKASIPDPPLLVARMFTEKAAESGIKITGKPSTMRLLNNALKDSFKILSMITSPPLEKIVEILNHESVNLYAEHLVKELGFVIKGEGTFRAGHEVINEFLTKAGIKTGGIRIYDGSGLSPVNRLNARMISSLLYYMKNQSPVSEAFYNSLPEAGREGTLKNVFSDQIFESRMRAKSGTMTGVRNYAGYLTTKSGRELIFCIMVNNFSGTTNSITLLIQEILKEAALNH